MREALVARSVRGTVDGIISTAHEYLFCRDSAAPIVRQRDVAARKLKEYFEGVNPGEEGHKELLFSHPDYQGLQLRHSESQLIDPVKAKALVTAKDLKARVVSMVESWNFDELYVLNQQGEITDDELDGLFVTQESWSLQVLK